MCFVIRIVFIYIFTETIKITMMYKIFYKRKLKNGETVKNVTFLRADNIDLATKY